MKRFLRYIAYRELYRSIQKLLALLLGFNRAQTVLDTNYRKVTVSVRSHAVYLLSSSSKRW